MEKSVRTRITIILLYIRLWLILRLHISWKKAIRGPVVQCIGFELQLHGKQNCDFIVPLIDSKREKLLDTLEEIGKYEGVFPLKLL